MRSRWRGKEFVVCELFFLLMYCVYMCICTCTHVHAMHVSMYVCMVCNVYNACLYLLCHLLCSVCSFLLLFFLPSLTPPASGLRSS